VEDATILQLRNDEWPQACSRHALTLTSEIRISTGHRWRAERGGLAPLRLPEAERGDRYLSLGSSRDPGYQARVRVGVIRIVVG
jgi:hypothetical protein